MRLVTAAIVANLTAAGVVAGRGEKPKTQAGWQGAAGTSVYSSYTVVHSMSGGNTDGPIDGPDEDLSPLYQLSCHGATQEQCELEAERAHRVMTSTEVPFTVAGRRVMRVVVDQLPGAMWLDDMQPPEWQSAARYRFLTTPTS